MKPIRKYLHPIIMKDDGKYDTVVLCYIDGDDAALKLYEKLGFRLLNSFIDQQLKEFTTSEYKAPFCLFRCRSFILFQELLICLFAAYSLTV